MEGTPAKRGRGRPRKTETNELPRRKRGRPRKNETIPETDSELGDGEEEIEATPKNTKSVPARRGPGRPPKKNPVSVGETHPEPGDDEEIEGTPKTAKSVPARRGPGRPRKVEEAKEDEEEGEEESDDEEDDEDETDAEAFEAKAIIRRGPHKGKTSRVEVRPSHGRKTRSSARKQQRDIQHEADGSEYSDRDDPNEIQGRQQTRDAWQPDGREEKIIVNELREAFSQRVAYAVKRSKSKPPITKERIEQSDTRFYKFEAQDPKYWSEEDENGLSKKWKKCSERTALELLVNYGFTLGTVFKLTFELFNIDPLSMLSWVSDFELDITDNQVIKHRGSRVNNPLWPHAFCEKLVRIMAHPIFRPRNACRLIPIVIRWATMLRLDDRLGFEVGEVHLLNYAGCPNLGREDVPILNMTKMIDRFKIGQKTIHESGWFTSHWADLFLAVTKVVVPPEDGGSYGKLRIKNIDLTNVISALDSLSPPAMGVTCEAQFQMWHAGRSKRGYPSGLDEVKEAYEMGWKNAFRIRSVRDRKDEEDSRQPTNVGGSGSHAGSLDNAQSPARTGPNADNGDLERSQSLGARPPTATSSGFEQEGFVPLPDSPGISHGVGDGDDGVGGETRVPEKPLPGMDLDDQFDSFGIGNGTPASSRHSHPVSDYEEDHIQENSEGSPSARKRSGSPQASPDKRRRMDETPKPLTLTPNVATDPGDDLSKEPESPEGPPSPRNRSGSPKASVGERRRMDETPEPPTLPSNIVTNPDDDRVEEPESPEGPPSPKKRSGSPQGSPSKRRRVTDAQEPAMSNPEVGLMASNALPKTADTNDVRGSSTESFQSPGPSNEWETVVAKAWQDILTREPPKEGFGPIITEDRFGWPGPPQGIVDPTKGGIQMSGMETLHGPEMPRNPTGMSPSLNLPPENAPTGPRADHNPRGSGQMVPEPMDSRGRGPRRGGNRGRSNRGRSNRGRVNRGGGNRGGGNRGTGV